MSNIEYYIPSLGQDRSDAELFCFFGDRMACLLEVNARVKTSGYYYPGLLVYVSIDGDLTAFRMVEPLLDNQLSFPIGIGPDSIGIRSSIETSPCSQSERDLLLGKKNKIDKGE